MTYYPNNLDDATSLPIATSGGGSGSVPDATSSVKGILKLTNDLSGTANLPTVSGIQNKQISTTSPTNNQVLTWIDADNKWTPQTISIPSVIDATTSDKGIIQLAGDISGTATSITVTKIQNRSIQNTAPSDKQVLTWSNSNTRWEPQTLPNASNLQKGIIMISGDLAGTATSPTVAKIQTYDVSVQAPELDEVLTWNGSEWEPLPLPNATNVISGNITLDNDLGGTYLLPVVVGLQGNSVASTSPSNKNVLTWNNLSSEWQPQALPQASLEEAGIINLAGDLGGTASSPSVTKIRGKSISLTAPSSEGQVLTWDNSNSEWYPASIPAQQDATTLVKGLVQLSGDLSGTATSPTVVGLQGEIVSTDTPLDGYSLIYSNNEWTPLFIDGYSDLSILAGITQLIGSGSNTFTSVGAIEINPNYYGTNAIFIFEAILQATSSQTAQIRLYDVTNGAAVSGSTLQTTSTSPEYLSTIVNITQNAIYEAQIKITNVSPGVSDGVINFGTKIRVKYI